MIEELWGLGFTWRDARSFEVDNSQTSRRVWFTGYEGLWRLTWWRTGLDWIIQDYINKRGNASGCNVIASNLKSIGLWIQSRRVRERLAKLDPENNALRWGATIQHRKYQVPSLNSLWHLDGHHSLIRWKPVIHGCIGGFSRRIIFLLCCPNNRYKTVLGLFLNAVERYRPMAIES